jgi:hypothetical protein
MNKGNNMITTKMMRHILVGALTSGTIARPDWGSAQALPPPSIPSERSAQDNLCR